MLNQPIAADLTVPAGTPKTAPVAVTVPVTGNWITKVRLIIPSGHNGFTGWQLLLAGTVVVPYTGTGWITASDHVFEFDVERWAEQGQLTMQGYNTGTYPHTFHAVADAYPQEPNPPVIASIAGSSPAAAATDSIVADFSAEPDTTDETSSADTTAAPPDLDTTDLDLASSAPVIDVGTFVPAPEIDVLPPPGPAAPVDRSRPAKPPVKPVAPHKPGPVEVKKPEPKLPPHVVKGRLEPEPKPKPKPKPVTLHPRGKK